MRKALSLVAVLAAAASLVAPGVSSAAPAAPAAPATPAAPDVRWVACPADVAAEGLECGTLSVPLDYKKPEGRKIEVMISRLASKNPQKRRGILLTNPGGPSEGLTFPAVLKAAGLPQSVQDAYDVIGVDPRGLGYSTPVTCDLTEEQQYAGNVPPYAVTPADVRKRADETKKIARQCATSSTAYMLPHNTTANIARDLDRIRAALGERKASFLGYSYGTYLGSVYTTLFPRTTDRVVIDSNLGAGGWDVDANRLYGRGVEDTFPDFANWAAAHPGFGLGGTPEQVRAKYFDLAARLDTAPVQGVTGPLFRLLTFGGLYGSGDAPFGKLAAVWKALDTDTPLPPDNPPVPPRIESLVSGRFAVICADSRWPTSVATYERNVAVDRVRHPMFGAAGANIQPCAFWPDPVDQPVRISDRGPRNVLMAQNERDPATPLVGARSTRRAFGDRAVMVTADQGGHGLYVFGANRCADDKVTGFLLGGQRPAHDLKCAAEPSAPARGEVPAIG
ncbi:alpha/beta hydrolase [Actinosynnema sp. NPDC047251]|uniref:TAP domain containing protein n=1 Tax=Saccharothrix espanaensis (strain ATCC 51144 / DSM 44229 / JCM 9112 / NBRC 15066 / NRRL 15764) TaxID=1179773 RepID=K0JTI9_SACES|nr:alpha/beta hydrolase [Saccharothrix espanaensis]CCH31085.1 TAP domain containing protein [Saccharothrix espanaensis DSM 44229]